MLPDHIKKCLKILSISLNIDYLFKIIIYSYTILKSCFFVKYIIFLFLLKYNLLTI